MTNDDPRRKDKIILCVDDDEAIRDVLTHALGGAGYQAHVCRGGDECLSLLSTIEPQVILLDIDMPYPDGFTTLSEIRRRFPKLEARIVMLTAMRTAPYVHEAKLLGANDYLVKPFRVAQLIERVDFWMGLRT